MKRSLRNIKTSNAVGRASKDKMLAVILSVAERFPNIPDLNRQLNIQWSGRFALDATFFKIKGDSRALLLCSDFKSLDLIGYRIDRLENHESWAKFLIDIYAELTKSKLKKFFVIDGIKRPASGAFRAFPGYSDPVYAPPTNKEELIR